MQARRSSRPRSTLADLHQHSGIPRSPDDHALAWQPSLPCEFDVIVVLCYPARVVEVRSVREEESVKVHLLLVLVIGLQVA